MSSSQNGASGPTRANDAAPFPWTGMLALAAAAFLAVTSETLPTGLLPEIAAGLHSTTPETGMLVSVYAFTVVVAESVNGASKRHCQPQRVVDRGVGVARGDRVADAEELEGALRVDPDRLRPAGDESGVIDGAAVQRKRLQREIEIVQRPRAVIDDDLLDDPLFAGIDIVAADAGD